MAPSIERFSEIARDGFLQALPNPNLVICKPTSNSAVYVEFESNSAIGRLTYWEQGTAFCEILEITSGDQKFARHYEAESEAELLGAFNAFQTEVVKSLD